MTFEANHKFFKNCARNFCNFKHIAKTVSYCFQLKKFFEYSAKFEWEENFIECENIEDVYISDIENVENKICIYFNLTK